MKDKNKKLLEKAKKAALEVLLHNNHGPYRGFPRTAGWGYPEPYTRDLLISSLGILTTKNEKLIKSLKRVLETLAKNQSPLGHISSLVHDPQDRGSSDCTPLFLIGVGLWRKVMEEPDFLEEAAVALKVQGKEPPYSWKQSYHQFHNELLEHKFRGGIGWGRR